MKKPNILFICCDQQRWDCVGFNHRYPVRTPHIDRLAAEGMCFDNSYSPLPTCCPARQALLTGQRPERFGAHWNFDQGIPVGSVSKDAYSWARDLAKDGYRMGYVGKWHVSPTYTPLDFGYEDYVPLEDLCREQAKRHHDIHPGQSYTHGFFGDPCPYPVEDSLTHLNAENVIRLMDEYGDAPWHIKMDFPEPHLPCRPSEPFASMYPTVPKWKSFDDPLTDKPYIQKQMRLNWRIEDKPWEFFEPTVRYYYGIISQVDDAIGRVIAHLEEIGQLDNTIIIYTADHGDFCGDRGMMDKHYVMYDEVTRVPLVIRYPKLIQGGQHCKGYVTNMLDIVPTILDMAGLPVPEHLDGISLYPYLTGEQTESIRRYALSTYNGQQFGLFVQRMIRNDDFKYTWNPSDVDELYDLRKDPEELHNVVHDPAYADILKQLRLDLFEELKAVDDFTTKSSWLIAQISENRKI